MCGRYTLKTRPEKVAEACKLTEPPDLRPRYNIAPTQPVLAVRTESGSRRACTMTWGWVGRHGQRIINIRSETAPTKPDFSRALQSRRCVLPADGFYEWLKRSGEASLPHHIRSREDRLLLFAGLWMHATEPDQPDLVAILTTRPNLEVSRLHDRMPVVLDPSHLDLWLHPAAKEDELVPCLTPAPDGSLVASPVSDHVGKVDFDDPCCLAPPSTIREQLDLF